MTNFKIFGISGLFQAPVLTAGHRFLGVAALLGACFVVTHLVTVVVTCVVDGFNWGINAWILDIMGFIAAFYFAIQCGLSSNSKSVDFRKKNSWICAWAVITIGARILDILMLFGVVIWSEIYVTPEGPTLWSNVVSEVIFGMAFTVTALFGSLMLLISPQDVDPTQIESELK
ncbi:MAG TPA: hypothetical protein DCM54_16110 [Gammaproteobacteria bacterium]|nr:hypothetical protein [Gammaproteobacteria bacterium]